METTVSPEHTASEHIQDLRSSFDAHDSEQSSSRLLPPGTLQGAITPSDGAADVTDVEDPPNSATSSTHVAAPEPSSEPSSENQSLLSHTRTRSIYLDWWEEIVSALTSLVCMVLALAVLIYMDDQSMARWKLPVQPNTVVAFLATLIRATLIFPLAECLGHLKWTFFERPRTLDFMNTFDVASRGPMGAFKFLWFTRIKSPLSSCAAIATILLLVFQPSMQQTIEFATRSARMPNETAYATRATSYEDLEETSWPTLSYRFFQAVTGDKGDAFETHCSTSACDYPEFDTLAVYATCEDHVLSVSVLNDVNNCTFTNNATGREVVSPGLQDIRTEVEGLRWQEPFLANLSCIQDRFSFSMIFSNWIEPASSVPYTRLAFHPFGGLQHQPNTYTEWVGNITDPAQQEVYGYILPEKETMLVCKHLNVAEDRHGWLIYDTYDYILDSICFNKTTDLWRYFSGGQITPEFGEVHGTLTTCSLKPGVKHYGRGRTRKNRLLVEVDHSILKFRNATGQPDIDRDLSDIGSNTDMIHYCAGNTPNFHYKWSGFSMNKLGVMIQGSLSSAEFSGFLIAQASAFGWNSTVLFQRLAREVSSMIQSSANLNATNITGIAYGTELYVRVRWPWLIVPALTIIASTTILCLTMLDSNKRSYLFKNKILAALALEVHEWEGEEYGADGVLDRRAMRRLQQKSKMLTVRMQLPSGLDRGLKLKREQTSKE
ncbi:hypothetical protein NX059_001851 [Plenodomus lindquistii]|nr:hypothetical protein NX059_001851 [Plenodomus lindquistii]